MPTVISHSVVAVASALGFKSAKRTWKLWKFVALSIVCSVLPDADVFGYHFLYIPYNSFFGHRGFFHSPFFAAVVSLIVISAFYRKEAPFSHRWRTFLYFFILTASHGLLDALTNGGRGIALLSPFSNHRYFLPWTPLEVSPLGIEAFLSQRGLTVIENEVPWIWLPAVVGAVLLRIMRTKYR